jgi:hypothetical protein
VPAIEKETQQAIYPETEDQFALLWVAVPICGLIISTAAFYFASPVLLPLVIASILSVVFSGVASRLEPFCGRFLSAAIVVLLVIGFIAALGYFLTIQLTAVADQVSEYSDNIGNKIAALEKNTPPWLQHVKEAVTDVQRRVEGANPAPKKAPQVMAMPRELETGRANRRRNSQYAADYRAAVFSSLQQKGLARSICPACGASENSDRGAGA